jgi:uncharacterized protein (DUF111 family)
MARRAAVTSDTSFQSLSDAHPERPVRMPFASSHILPDAEGRVHGVAAARFHEVGALDRGQVPYMG